jgi:hypothetical protein
MTSHTKRYLTEAGMALALALGVPTHQRMPDVPQAVGQVSPEVKLPVPPSRITPGQRAEFDAEMDRTVSHIKSEMDKAKAKGKPPLIVLLEAHNEKNCLAKETGLALRLHQEGAVSDVLVETPDDFYKQHVKAAQNAYQGFINIANAQEKIRKENITPGSEYYQDVERIRTGVSGFMKDLYNTVVLRDVAAAYNIKVHSAESSTLAGYHDEAMTPAQFIPFTQDADSRLIRLVRSTPKQPKILVIGGLHGKAVTEAVGDEYHVIPVALANMEQEIPELAALKKLAESGARLGPEDKMIHDRDMFTRNIFQAVDSHGIDTVNAALDITGASQRIPHYWRVLDAGQGKGQNR